MEGSLQQVSPSDVKELDKFNELRKSLERIYETYQNLEQNILLEQEPSISIDTTNTLMNDIQTTIEQGHLKIAKSFEQYVASVNETMTQLLSSINELTPDYLEKKAADQRNSQLHHSTYCHGIFSSKVFKERISLLTEFDENTNFRTIENICIAFLILIGIQLCFDEYLDSGSLIPDLKLLHWCFGQIDKVFMMVAFMFFIHTLIVPLVQFIKSHVRSANQSIYPYLPLYAVLQGLLFIVGISSIIHYQLPTASAIIVSCEMVRMFMKVHSYFREKIVYGIYSDSAFANFIPNWAAEKGVTIADLNKPEINILGLGSELKRFVYYSFCPTLIYRDDYIRTKRIRIGFILKNVMTFLIAILYIWSVFKALCIPMFQNIAKAQDNSIRHLINGTMQLTITGMICLLVLFYGFIHGWLNVWSEVLKFGDRLFYEDWWNVKDFSSYYRKWNVIVHEFLYYYVYQDSIRLSKGMISRQNSRYIVFFISASFHELIVTLAFGQFYPVLFFMFGGPGVMFSKIKFGNGPYTGTMFWLLMMIGIGMMMALISKEWYGRQNFEGLIDIPDN